MKGDMGLPGYPGEMGPMGPMGPRGIYLVQTSLLALSHIVLLVNLIAINPVYLNENLQQNLKIKSTL